MQVPSVITRPQCHIWTIRPSRLRSQSIATTYAIEQPRIQQTVDQCIRQYSALRTIHSIPVVLLRICCWSHRWLFPFGTARARSDSAPIPRFVLHSLLLSSTSLRGYTHTRNRSAATSAVLFAFPFLLGISRPQTLHTRTDTLSLRPRRELPGSSYPSSPASLTHIDSVDHTSA